MQARLAEPDTEALDVTDPEAPANQIVEPHAAHHDLTAGLGAGEPDVVEGLRLDQRERVAGFRPTGEELAIALQPLAGDRGHRVDRGERLAGADVDLFDVHDPII